MAKGPLLAAHEQTVAQRRLLRTQYRRLGAETAADKENVAYDGGALCAKLQQLDQLHQQVVRPREHAVDAEVFAQLAECSLSLIRRGQASNAGRAPSDLARALRLAYVGDPALAAGGVALPAGALDWAALGAEAAPLFRPAPGIGCMLGPLDAQVKVRRAAVRQQKRPLDAEVRPDELQGGGARGAGEDQQETDRNMEAMWGRLTARGAAGAAPVRLVRLVLNRRSFAQTVENVFTLSFLVRDLRVRLLADEAGGIQVQPVGEAERAAATQAGTQAQQFMVDFTMADWELMKRLVAPGEELMPHRGPAEPPAAGRGGGGGGKRARVAAA